jgi:nitric oxide synthase-interacting protein
MDFCACREPLISPDGFIFDKEAILNYILDQKEAYKRKLQLWEQQNRVNAEKAEAVSGGLRFAAVPLGCIA